MSVIEKCLRQQCDNTIDYVEQNILPELDKYLTIYYDTRKNILNKELQATTKDYKFLEKLLKVVNKTYL